MQVFFPPLFMTIHARYFLLNAMFMQQFALWLHNGNCGLCGVWRVCIYNSTQDFTTHTPGYNICPLLFVMSPLLFCVQAAANAYHTASTESSPILTNTTSTTTTGSETTTLVGQKDIKIFE
jgi:hypothetical protein